MNKLLLTILLIPFFTVHLTHSFTIRWCNLTGKELGKKGAGMFDLVGQGISCYDGLNATIEYTNSKGDTKKVTLYGASDPANCKTAGINEGFETGGRYTVKCGYCSAATEPKPSTWLPSWSPGYSNKSTWFNEKDNGPFTVKASVVWNNNPYSVTFQASGKDNILLKVDAPTGLLTAYKIGKVTKDIGASCSCFNLDSCIEVKSLQRIAVSEESLETQSVGITNLTTSELEVTLEPFIGSPIIVHLAPVTSPERAKTIPYQGEHLKSLSWKATDGSFSGQVTSEDLSDFEHVLVNKHLKENAGYKHMFKSGSVLIKGNSYKLATIDSEPRKVFSIRNDNRRADNLVFIITPQEDIPQRITLPIGKSQNIRYLGATLSKVEWSSPDGGIKGELEQEQLGWPGITVTAKAVVNAQEKTSHSFEVSNLTRQDIKVSLESDLDDSQLYELGSGQKKDLWFTGKKIISLTWESKDGSSKGTLANDQLGWPGIKVTPKAVVNAQERISHSIDVTNLTPQDIKVSLESDLDESKLYEVGSGQMKDLGYTGRKIISLSWESKDTSVKGKLTDDRLSLSSFTITPQKVIASSGKQLLGTKEFINTTTEDVKIKIESEYMDPVFATVPEATTQSSTATITDDVDSETKGIKKVTRALYYARRLDPVYDVTAHFDYAMNTQNMILVRPDWLGGDPALGIPKTLLIEYSDSRTHKPMQKWFNDGEQVQFGPDEQSAMSNHKVYYGVMRDTEMADVTVKAKQLVKNGVLRFDHSTETLNSVFGPVFGQSMKVMIDYVWEKPTEKVVTYYGPAKRITFQAKDKSFQGSIKSDDIMRFNTYELDEGSYKASNKNINAVAPLLPPSYKEEL